MCLTADGSFLVTAGQDTTVKVCGNSMSRRGVAVSAPGIHIVQSDHLWGRGR